MLEERLEDRTYTQKRFPWWHKSLNEKGNPQGNQGVYGFFLKIYGWRWGKIENVEVLSQKESGKVQK